MGKVFNTLLVFWGSLLHHGAVLRESLKNEKAAPKAATHTRAETEFMPAVLEVRECPPSPLGRWTMITILSVFTIGITWAVIGEVDIIATAQGKIIPSGNVKRIQPLETGVVRAIHVQDGQVVKKGDILIELDPTGVRADQDRLTKEYNTARITVARMDALASKSPLKAYAPPADLPPELVAQHKRHLSSELAERSARRDTLLSDINRLRRTLPNIRERVKAKKTLVDKKIAARLPYLELKQELIDTEEQMASAKAKLAQLDAEDQRGAMDRLADAQQKADTLEQELIKASERNRLQTLLAPVDGMVQQLAMHTVGGVVTPAQDLMTIVPDDNSIEIEAMVANKDIGFVKDGQEIEIKVESFPFTKYGTLPGSVKTISRDAVQQENQGWLYPARFTLDEVTILAGNKYVPLTPGMAVTVEIKTGKRQLIQYLLAPLQEYQDESMRER